MSTPAFFAQRLATELPAFEKVLRALPAEKLDYKPHERNKAAGDLAWQIAEEMGGLKELFETGDIDYNAGETPSHESICTAIKRNGEEAIEAAKNVSEERWNGKGRFLWGGQPVWESTVSDIAWGFLFDMVHHRGQLSAYLRPMGGKVPAIYGPSGDDTGRPAAE
jgi:uncharacterized damage-inducible protein DinB